MCWEVFEKEDRTKCPKQLPCVHIFCVSCLTQLEENDRVRCPYCRSLHEIPNGGCENFPTYLLAAVKSPETDDNGSGTDLSENNSRCEETNDNVNSEVVALLPGNQATTRDDSCFKTFTKYSTSVICFPIWFTFLIAISLVAIVMGFVLGLCYQIYVALTIRNLSEDTMDFVEPFVNSFFDRTASFIEHYFCLCGVDYGYSVIPDLCRKISKVATAVVAVLQFLLTIVLFLIIIVCSLMAYVIMAVVYLVLFLFTC